MRTDILSVLRDFFAFCRSGAVVTRSNRTATSLARLPTERHQTQRKRRTAREVHVEKPVANCDEQPTCNASLRETYKSVLRHVTKTSFLGEKEERREQSMDPQSGLGMANFSNLPKNRVEDGWVGNEGNAYQHPRHLGCSALPLRTPEEPWGFSLGWFRDLCWRTIRPPAGSLLRPLPFVVFKVFLASSSRISSGAQGWSSFERLRVSSSSLLRFTICSSFPRGLLFFC